MAVARDELEGQVQADGGRVRGVREQVAQARAVLELGEGRLGHAVPVVQGVDEDAHGGDLGEDLPEVSHFACALQKKDTNVYALDIIQNRGFTRGKVNIIININKLQGKRRRKNYHHLGSSSDLSKELGISALSFVMRHRREVGSSWRFCRAA